MGGWSQAVDDNDIIVIKIRVDYPLDSLISMYTDTWAPTYLQNNLFFFLYYEHQSNIYKIILRKPYSKALHKHVVQKQLKQLTISWNTKISVLPVIITVTYSGQTNKLTITA